MELGTKIKRLRLQKNLTQEELADRCEVTKGYISQLENELTSPSITTLEDILNALGTTFADFFKDEKEEKVVFTEAEFIEKIDSTHKIEWLVPNAQKNEMEPIRVNDRTAYRARRRRSPRRRGVRLRAFGQSLASYRTSGILRQKRRGVLFFVFKSASP